ncbi:unnamed protein product [Arabis nemorensis]|uniref:Uncharacterized protein n=1 Tax=Arabis nemorensis TaxID=586526 RepID=A0A565BKK3_9BRAS|nr:unnamed protein product [Arabis nemorensis]
MANRHKGKAAVATDGGGGREGNEGSGGGRDTSVSRGKGNGVATTLSDGSGGSRTVSARGGGTDRSGAAGSRGRGAVGSRGRGAVDSRGRGAVGSCRRATAVGSHERVTAGVPTSTDAGSVGSKRQAAYPSTVEVVLGPNAKPPSVKAVVALEPTPVLVHPPAVYMVALGPAVVVPLNEQPLPHCFGQAYRLNDEDELDALDLEDQDFDQLLGNLLQLLGREQLMRLSVNPIPNLKSICSTSAYPHDEVQAHDTVKVLLAKDNTDLATRPNQDRPGPTRQEHLQRTLTFFGISRIED